MTNVGTIGWGCKQTDLSKQKMCALFMHLFFDKMGMPCQVYNHTVKGKFIFVDENNNHRYINELHLLGVTSYNKNFASVYSETATDQFSFVFNNYYTFRNCYELITFEELLDFAKPYSIEWEKSLGNDLRQGNRVGILRRGAQVRILETNEVPLVKMLTLVSILFLPELYVSNDYDLFNIEYERLTSGGITELLNNEATRWEAIELTTKDLVCGQISKSDIDQGRKDFWNITQLF